MQVYTAEEKAALAMVNFEENKRKVGLNLISNQIGLLDLAPVCHHRPGS